jgi:hypothetical protein
MALMLKPKPVIEAAVSEAVLSAQACVRKRRRGSIMFKALKIVRCIQRQS